MLKIASFSRVLAGTRLQSDEMETAGIRWRLVAFPKSSAGPTGAVAAYVEAQTGAATVQATVSIRVLHPRNRAASLCYIFTREFKPVAGQTLPAKGFSCLAVASSLEADGFLADSDTLTLAATFLPTAGAPPEAVVADVRDRAFSSQVLRVEGFPAHQQDGARVFGRWEQLGTFGHWRLVAFPRGTSAQQHDHVAATVELRPMADAKPGWHLRCAMDVHVAKPESAATSAASASQLSTFVEFTENKLAHQITRLVAIKDVLGQPSEWLADDALLIAAALRTDPATGPTSTINDKRVTEAVERLQTTLKNAGRRAADLAGFISTASALAARDADAAKQMSIGFAEQHSALKAHLSAIAEIEAKLKQHASESSALQQEQERLSGACKPEELSALEDTLTTTLQKLLILQGKGGVASPSSSSPASSAPETSTAAKKSSKDAAKGQTAEPPESLSKQCAALAAAVRAIAEWSNDAAILAEEVANIRALLGSDLAALTDTTEKRADEETKLREKEKAATASLAQLQQIVAVLHGDDTAIAALQPGQVKEFVEAVSRAHKAVISKQAVQQFLLEQQKAKQQQS